MKIKPLTLFAVVALAISGVYFFSEKARPPKETTVASQQPKLSQAPLASPNKELKANEKFIEHIGLYITVPEGMTFRKEIDDDPGRQNVVGFYIEKETAGELVYQLYAIYPASNYASEEGLTKARKEMEKSTIKEVVIGEHKAIEGIITGAKNRFFTAMVINDKLLTFSTYPPTEENKAITDQILSTVSFQKN